MAGHLLNPVSLQLAPGYMNLTRRSTRTARALIGLATSAACQYPYWSMTPNFYLLLAIPDCCSRMSSCWQDLRTWLQIRETTACLQKPRGSVTGRQGKMQRRANSLQIGLRQQIARVHRASLISMVLLHHRITLEFSGKCSPECSTHCPTLFLPSVLGWATLVGTLVST